MTAATESGELERPVAEVELSSVLLELHDLAGHLEAAGTKMAVILGATTDQGLRESFELGTESIDALLHETRVHLDTLRRAEVRDLRARLNAFEGLFRELKVRTWIRAAKNHDPCVSVEAVDAALTWCAKAKGLGVRTGDEEAAVQAAAGAER